MTQPEIIEGLRSHDPEAQMTALDNAAHTVVELMRESVHAFVDAASRYPIAEKLFKFGPSIVPMLEDLLDGSADQDAKDLAAAIIVKLGVSTGVPILLAVLDDRRAHFPMAALILAEAQVHEAVPSIQKILRDWDCVADPYSAVTMIDALKKLNALDDPLRQFLKDRWPPAMRLALEKVLSS